MQSSSAVPGGNRCLPASFPSGRGERQFVLRRHWQRVANPASLFTPALAACSLGWEHPCDPDAVFGVRRPGFRRNFAALRATPGDWESLPVLTAKSVPTRRFARFSLRVNGPQLVSTVTGAD